MTVVDTHKLFKELNPANKVSPMSFHMLKHLMYATYLKQINNPVSAQHVATYLWSQKPFTSVWYGRNVKLQVYQSRNTSCHHELFRMLRTHQLPVLILNVTSAMLRHWNPPIVIFFCKRRKASWISMETWQKWSTWRLLDQVTSTRGLIFLGNRCIWRIFFESCIHQLVLTNQRAQLMFTSDEMMQLRHNL